MSASQTAAPALRADAARNRQAIVVAARSAFAERGLDAPFDEIARRADVGNATLYRHFPSRCQLVSAVFVNALEDVLAEVGRALAEADPWTGFESYVRYLCRLQATDRGFADLLTVAVTGAPELEALRTRAQGDFRELSRRAIASGRLRPDFAAEDLALLLMANAGVVRRTTEVAPNAWRRFADYLLDALRASDQPRVALTPSDGRVAIDKAMRDEAAHLNCG